jgi:hypothetical protein
MLIFTLMNLMTGCETQQAPSAPSAASGQSRVLLYGQSADIVDQDDPVFDIDRFYATTLPDGTSVDAYLISFANDTIFVRYGYSDPGGEYVNRLLKISQSLTSVVVCDQSGTLLGGYRLTGATNQANLYVWSGTDFASVTSAETDTAVHLNLVDGERKCSVSFATRSEIESAASLYQEVNATNGMRSLSIYEQGLLDKVTNWGNAVGQAGQIVSADLSVAMYLMADEGFIDSLGDRYGEQLITWFCGVHCICGIASFLSLACLAVPWCVPCWVICIPAAGIALACALADIIAGDKA